MKSARSRSKSPKSAKSLKASRKRQASKATEKVHLAKLGDFGPVPPPPLPFENLVNLLQSSEYNPLKQLYDFPVTKHALQKLSPQELRDLKFLFETLDTSGQGCLHFVGLRRAMRALGFTVTDKDITNSLSDYASDQTKGVTMQEFFLLIADLQGSDRDYYAEIRSTFELMAERREVDFKDPSDTSNDSMASVISIESLRNLNETLKLGFTNSELEDMLDLADQNGDYVVDCNEFMTVMQETGMFH